MEKTWDLPTAGPGERVWVLLDEALADFLEPGEDAASLAGEIPNLLVFRTFAKAHNLPFPDASPLRLRWNKRRSESA